MNKHIEELKKLHAPWWSRLLGDWRARRAAKAARKRKYHICTINVWSKRDDSIRASYLHLYETGDGKRSFKYVKGNGYMGDVDCSANYNHWVIPWLHRKKSTKDLQEVAKSSYKVPTEWV